MRTLVTGATGLLGSFIVEGLAAKGHAVRALARRTSDTSYLETTGADIVYGDVEDCDSLPPAVEGAGIVFHAAGRVTPGWGKWEEFENTTVKGTLNLLKASAEAGVPRFLFISSVTVCGKLACGDTPADETVPAAVEFTPDSYYDYAKKKAEEAVMEYNREGRIKATVIRPAMIYGPRDRLLSDRVYRQTSNPIIVWPGKSNPRCAPVFASDVAECAILAATSDRAIGQIYNVAPLGEIWLQEFCGHMIKAEGGRRVQVTIPYRFAYVCCAIMEAWSRLRRVKQIPYLTRSGLRFLNEGMYIDGSKAMRELGWQPKVSMEEGTRLYVEWRRGQAKK
jgi:nucleoside-diphosphate-sugar epimerase